jgi:hypothetical protein
LPAEPEGEAAAIARWIAARGGGAVAAVVFFGSRKHRARPQAGSAYDLFLVTPDYKALYRAFRSAGLIHRSAHLLAVLNRFLPPNQLSIRPEPGVHAKCAVVSLRHLRRETSERRRDQFIGGRLFQPAEVVYSASAADGDAVLDCLTGAHVLTYAWVRPWLPAVFDAGEYGRTLLRVSFGREIRPEPGTRVDALWDAQQDYFRSVYGILLEDLAAAGELVPVPGGHTLARPPSLLEQLRVRARLRWSLVRATLRWGKHVMTFEGWLDFLLGKASRHTGREIVLTPRERRMPLVFLWPRVLRYLRHKDREGP